MSENSERMTDEIVENLKRPSAWFRVVFMAGFVVALYVTGIILLVLMLAQIVFSLLTGNDNPNLRRLGAGLSLYVSQTLAYLTYNSDDKPFPFQPFPLAGSDDAGAAELDSAGALRETAAESDAASAADSEHDHAQAAPKRSARRKKATDIDGEHSADE